MEKSEHVNKQGSNCFYLLWYVLHSNSVFAAGITKSSGCFGGNIFFTSANCIQWTNVLSCLNGRVVGCMDSLAVGWKEMDSLQHKWFHPTSRAVKNFDRIFIFIYKYYTIKCWPNVVSRHWDLSFVIYFYWFGIFIERLERFIYWLTGWENWEIRATDISLSAVRKEEGRKTEKRAAWNIRQKKHLKALHYTTLTHFPFLSSSSSSSSSFFALDFQFQVQLEGKWHQPVERIRDFATQVKRLNWKVTPFLHLSVI